MRFTKFGKALLVGAASMGVILGVASCVESYTVGFLYVTGTVTSQPSGSGIISGFKIDHNTGDLKPINGLPISSGGANPVRAVLITGSRFFYVLNKGVNSAGNGNCTTADPCKNSNITQFAVGGAGILTPEETFFTQGINPIRLIGDTSGNYLFVLDHDAPSSQGCKLALGGNVSSCGDITVFQINPTTGRLQLVLNAQITLPSGAALPYFPVPANPIDFALSSGFIETVSGTPSTGDSSFPYTYNPNNGQLTVNQNASQALNAHEATAAVATSGFMYVLDNEPVTQSINGQTITSQSQILPFTVGTNGSLQAEVGGAVPDDPTEANPTQLLVESKNKWLYVSNQGDNNTSTGNAQSGITGYVIDPSQHTLSFIAGEPFGSGAGPQCIVEDPSDQFIYTANYYDSTVTGKVLDQNSGVLNDLVKNSSYALTGPATWCVVNGRTD